VLPRGAAQREISRTCEDVGVAPLAENETEEGKSVCRVTFARQCDVC